MPVTEERRKQILEDLETMSAADRESLNLLAIRTAFEEVRIEQESGNLKKHLDKQCVKGYCDADTYERWNDLKERHRLVEADAIRDQAWDSYQESIKKHGNPADQIENFETAGIIMQDKQLQFASAARKADSTKYANEIGMGGARGPGKSFAIFAVATLDDCQRFPGIKVLYLRRSAKKASEQALDLVKSVLPRFDDKEVRQSPSFKVRFGNGSEIIVGYFKNDTDALEYQGLEYDILIIEEATHLSLFAYRELRTSVRSSKEGFRPRTYVSTNPGGIGHSWFKKRFVDPEKKRVPFAERENKTHFIFATVDDNRHVNKDYRNNLEDLSELRKEMFLYGNWDVSSGAFFYMWDTDYHVVDNFETLPEGMRLWASMDYGFGHWNVIYLIGQEGERIYLIHELAHRRKYPKDIAPDFMRILKQYNLEYSQLQFVLAGADVFRKTGAAELTIQQKYMDEGIILYPADTSPGSRSAGAQHMAELFGDYTDKNNIRPSRLYVCRNCEKFIDTIPYLEHDPNNLEDVLKIDTNVDDGSGGDDPYDAARYGVFTPQVGSMASGKAS